MLTLFYYIKKKLTLLHIEYYVGGNRISGIP